MTTMDRFEATLPGLLEDLGRTDASQLIADVLASTAGTRQRPPMLAWVRTTFDRRDPRPLFGTLPMSLRVGLALALLLVAIAAAALIVGGTRTVPTIPTAIVLGGSFTTDSLSPTALALPDGRLVVGGGGGPVLARVFDSRSRSVTNVGTAVESVQLQGAALLADGRVFLLGWEDADPASNGRSMAWVFDPRNGTLSPPVPTLDRRFEASVVGRADGSVVVTGGIDNPESSTTLASTEIFDPATGAFAHGLPLASPRFGHRATALPGGDLLLVGGDRADASNLAVPAYAVERFDPRTGETQKIDDLPGGSWRAPLLVWLPDGRLLVVPNQTLRLCGRHGIDPVTPFVFTAATNALEPALPLPHDVAAAVPLPDGRLVIAGSWQAIPGGCGAGGSYVDDAWLGIYDPMTGRSIESRDPITGSGDLAIDALERYSAGAVLSDGHIALVSELGVDLLTMGTP